VLLQNKTRCLRKLETNKLVRKTIRIKKNLRKKFGEEEAQV
jgi:hypothetical protein